MAAFRRFAFAIVARDASFVALAVATLMLGFSFAPALSLAIGAHAALAFAIVTILRAVCLCEDGIQHTEPWRNLDPHDRPTDEFGRRLARDSFQDVLLRFARAAAGVAVLLYGASLVISLNVEDRTLRAVVSQFHG